MAFCMNCGQQLPDGANFCLNCGTKLGETKTDNTQRKTVYDGDLHKCPNCGNSLNSFETRCGSCGYELRGAKKTSCVHELSIKLETTEKSAKKIELISNFYIPNTKEDIYEFFILAYSNISAGVSEVDAWTAKLEQAYLKAKISFGNDSEFLYIQELYEKLQKTSKKTQLLKSQALKPIITMLAGFTFAIICIIIGYIDNEEFFIVLSIIGAIPLIVGMIMFFIVEFKSILKK